jgi:23S rRNA (adenine2030-N6)-methyltransferase
MNYRHIFHAGNAVDVFKHAILCRIIAHLLKKETPFRVIDTHAGTGLYDLTSVQANKTGEWRDGIGRLKEPLAPEEELVLETYRHVLSKVQNRFGATFYPGSPQIIREMLRPGDKGILVERHVEDARRLKQRYEKAATMKVMPMDGWIALHGLVPPREKRGLVLIDPPYEEPGEHARLAQEISKAWRKWPNGIYMGWYPIKELGPANECAHILQKEIDAEILRIEMLTDPLSNLARLNGAGLMVVNPPWTLAQDMHVLLPSLSQRLAKSGAGDYRVLTLKEKSI